MAQGDTQQAVRSLRFPCGLLSPVRWSRRPPRGAAATGTGETPVPQRRHRHARSGVYELGGGGAGAVGGEADPVGGKADGENVGAVTPAAIDPQLLARSP